MRDRDRVEWGCRTAVGSKPGGSRRRPEMRMKIRKGIAITLLAAALSVGATSARADRYNPAESAHPLRIVAYALHPVGVLIDTLIFRPAHWFVHQEPMATLFGHRD